MTQSQKFANVGAYLLMLLVNVLANSLPLNGITTQEISDLYPVLFTPAGYVFAIWGLIYLLLAAFLVFQFVQPHDPRLPQVGPWFVVTSVFNILWLFAWHWQMINLSIIIMFALLISLIILYQRVRARRGPALGYLFVSLPFSVYLGWISVATIANLSVVLYVAEWSAWGISQVGWTAIMIAVAGLLAAAMVLLQRDFAFALVVVWALSGIGVSNEGTFSLVFMAWGTALLISMFLGWNWASRRRVLKD